MMIQGGRYQDRPVLAPSSLQAMFSPQWVYDGHNGDTCGQTLLTYGLGEFFVDGTGAAAVAARPWTWGHGPGLWPLVRPLRPARDGQLCLRHEWRGPGQE